MRSERTVFFVSALAVLSVTGLLVYLEYDSSSNTLENSPVQVPAGWEKINVPEKKIIPYDYNHTFILNIESIKLSTYYITFFNILYYADFANDDQEIQNNNMEAGKIGIEGVEVLYEKHIVFNTTNDLKTINNLQQYYMFQKDGKFYIVRFGYFSKNSTDSSIINSSSALFNETLKSIIRTI
ncbi:MULTISPECIES: hypothetical protein [Methanobacterium]|jgi:hypothetical protein|uniref:hypothetical protein n=1 Tax=Methanobacterium TaxID=2160 RepID=UPI00257E557D|nr:hypothetical protein [Methanobacterium sp.]